MPSEEDGNRQNQFPPPCRAPSTSRQQGTRAAKFVRSNDVVTTAGRSCSMNPAMCNTMIQSKRYLRIEANNKCIGNLARTAGMNHVLQVGAEHEPWRKLRAIVDFGNAL